MGKLWHSMMRRLRACWVLLSSVESKRLVRGVRNFTIYAMGVGLTLNEFLSRSDDRQWHIVLCAALLGLPSILNRDERRR